MIFRGLSPLCVCVRERKRVRERVYIFVRERNFMKAAFIYDTCNIGRWRSVHADNPFILKD